MLPVHRPSTPSVRHPVASRVPSRGARFELAAPTHEPAPPPRDLAHPRAPSPTASSGPSHAGTPGAHVERRSREHHREREELDDRDPAPLAEVPLDPLERALWTPRAPILDPVAAPAPPAVVPPPALDALVDRFLKRFAMSGGKRRGAAHVEIGAGELAGAAITFEADGAEVRVVVDAPPGVDATRFATTVRERLRARGVSADVEVR